MTLTIKRKRSAETGRQMDRCWVSDCHYTIALCGVGDHAMYQVTAPRGSKPFAYTPRKEEVKSIIVTHKAAQE